MVEHRRNQLWVALMLVATIVGQVTWVLVAYRARLQEFVEAHGVGKRGLKIKRFLD